MDCNLSEGAKTLNEEVRNVIDELRKPNAE